MKNTEKNMVAEIAKKAKELSPIKQEMLMCFIQGIIAQTASEKAGETE